MILNLRENIDKLFLYCVSFFLLFIKDLSVEKYTKLKHAMPALFLLFLVYFFLTDSP